MRKLVLFALVVFLTGCNVTDNGRYQLVAPSSFNVYRIDTQTGQVTYVEAAGAITNRPGYQDGQVTTVMPAIN